MKRVLSKLAQRRILKLASFMEALPEDADKHFDMIDWLSHSDEGHSHFKDGQKVSIQDLFSCGTAACAFGWAAVVPEFNKAGLKLKAFVHLDYLAKQFVIKGEEIEDSYAAAKLWFDLDLDWVKDLFGCDRRIQTPKQWATRARQFVKQHSR